VLRDPAREGGHRDRLVGVDGLFGPADAAGLSVVDDPLVAGGLAGDQPLAQAAHGADHDPVAGTADRVSGEGHAGRVGVDHALDHHGHRRPPADLTRAVKGLLAVLPVGGDPLAECRRPAAPDGVGELVAVDVQEGLVQAGVGGAGQVLGGR
jgi:hypothetical protein